MKHHRRSLNSPFVLSQLSQTNSDDEKDDVLNNTSTIMSIPSFQPPMATFDNNTTTTTVHSPKTPTLDNSTFNNSPNRHSFNMGAVTTKGASISANQSKRYSMYNMSNNSNISISVNGTDISNIPIPSRKTHHHRRTSSMAAEAYTPQPPMPPMSPAPDTSSPSKGPFNFGSISMNTSNDSLVLPKANYRRGHRYKHSSVSMNMFQEAPAAQPIELPKSFTVPSFNEVLKSITSAQKWKILTCCLQLFMMLVSYTTALRYGSGCLATLAHVLFYDLVSNSIVVSVGIMANFDVWRRNSLMYPFGLGRIEVLCSFGLSVSLLFVGLDLFSHIIEELIIRFVSSSEDNVLSHAHDGHIHEDSNPIHPLLYTLLILSIITISLFTSHTVHSSSSNLDNNNDSDDSEYKNYSAPTRNGMKRLSSITLSRPARQSLTTRFLSLLGLSVNENQKGKRNVLSSSTTILTTVYSMYCLYYPFAQGSSTAEYLNQGSTLLLAILIFFVALKLIKRYAYTLLLGNPINGLESEIKNNIRHLDAYRSNYNISQCKVAKVHNVWIIIVVIDMKGASDDEEAKLRFYSMRIIKGLLGRGEQNNKRVVSGSWKNEEERRSLIDLIQSGDDDGDGEWEITIDARR